jgi:hypothetical protein
VIGALQELLWIAAGRDASLPRYLFVCVAGGGLLATAWLPGMREMAERMQASGAFETRSPWPWRRKRSAPPAPPLPPARTTFRRDFLVALPFAAVMMLVLSATVAGVRDTIAPAGLLTNLTAALFAAALIAFRTSVWGLVLFSLAGGLLGGLAMALLSVMTFSDPGLDDILLIGWGLGSAMLFVFAYPLWRGLRDLEARGFRLPMWLVMGGSVLLVTGAALVSLAEHYARTFGTSLSSRPSYVRVKIHPLPATIVVLILFTAPPAIAHRSDDFFSRRAGPPGTLVVVHRACVEWVRGPTGSALPPGEARAHARRASKAATGPYG